jgi:hypothetical protein
MVHNKETLLKVAAFIGLPAYVDRDDPEINEIKNYLITKHARATIQDALIDADLGVSFFKALDFDNNMYYWVTLEDGDGFIKQFQNQCHNMAWLDAAAWWVNERSKP